MSSPSTDDDRVLNRLLHDLRTPLGVAHGYLRMIRDHRLTTPELQEKALEGVTNALAQMTRLCDQIAGRAPIDVAGEPPHSAADFAGALAERLLPLGIACDIDGSASAGRLRADDAGAVLDATILLICGLLAPRETCTIDIDGPTLVVRRRHAGGTTTLLTLPLETAPS